MSKVVSTAVQANQAGHYQSVDDGKPSGHRLYYPTQISSMVTVWKPKVGGRSLRALKGMLNSKSAFVSDLHRLSLS